MAVRIPRISLSVDYGDEASLGDISLPALGFGLHFAWMLSAMFSVPDVFAGAPFSFVPEGAEISAPYLVSIAVTIGARLAVAVADERFARVAASQKALAVAAVMAAAGTAIFMVPGFADNVLAQIACGVLTGIGSGWLVLMWGMSYARFDANAIALNTAIAIPAGMAVYTVLLRMTPPTVSAGLTCLIPLAEALLIRQCMLAARHGDASAPRIPTLPIRRVRFMVRFGLPVLALGWTLSLLRQTSVQVALPATTTSDQLIILVASAFATVVILVTILATSQRNEWDRFFRPLGPFLAVALLLIPFSISDNKLMINLAILIAYFCFEALMWTFYGSIAQRFRLSPLLVFGTGTAALSVGVLVGSFTPPFSSSAVAEMPFGEQFVTVCSLVVMMAAYALLPREQEVKALVLTNAEPAAASAARSADARSAGLDDVSSAKTVNPAAASSPASPAAASAPATVSTPAAPTPPATSTAAASVPPASRAARVANMSAQVAPAGSAPAGKTPKRRFHAKCESVANTYLLSAREAEVLFFLAKGHNAAYLQEKLFISESTARTHIQHIYRKLDVHNQQELMRLVEDTEVEG